MGQLPDGFVYFRRFFPQAAQEIRYATAHNLTGHPLAGYHAGEAVLTLPAARALKKAADRLAEEGFGILIYDAYRPQKAVDDFVAWSLMPEDGSTREEFYPALTKEELFPKGYIARNSGHSRGSTVDLTLTRNGVPVDMGTCFDRMDIDSHHGAAGISPEAESSRALLRGVMAWAGFLPLESEWWHYRLMGEPWPDRYFDFDIEPGD